MQRLVGGSKVRKIDAGLSVIGSFTFTSPHISGRSAPPKKRSQNRFRYKCRTCRVRLERTRWEIKALKHPSLCQNCALDLHRPKATVAPEKIIRLAKSGKFTTQRCIAEEVGLSRERVRQVLKREGVRFGHQQGTDLIWPCPECGETITVPYGLRNDWTFMPAHCRRCADGYCKNGHKRTVENTQIDSEGIRTCRICLRTNAQRIVRYRTCIDCGKVVPVTDNSERTAKSLGNRLERCQQCAGKNVASLQREILMTHCRRGHPFDEENTYVYKGVRHCRTCVRMRRRRTRAEKKKIQEIIQC